MEGASKGIMQHDGEGIVLRKAASLYIHGRNIHLIKFKSAHHDKEGLVVGIDHDCITLKLPTGVTFEVEMEDVHTPSAPQLGDVVTFTYGISSRRELPENPKIVRIRTDIKWDDLLSSGTPHLKKDLKMERYSAKPQNYWSFENMRTFMKKIIEGYNLDPLLPQSWFSIPKNSIAQSKGVRTIVQKFGGYFKTLNALFPDIGMQDYKSSYLRIWREPTYRRQFFEGYAKEQGFDPLFANNWHQHSFTAFKSKKAESLLKYHGHSIKQALIDLFPEIGLERSKFVYRVNRVFHLDNTFAKWKNPENRRYFFENFAKEHGFDPLNPDNWTTERRRDVSKAKGGHGVLHYYIDNVRKALVDLFPDVNWENSKSITHSYKYWKEPNARRKFFENYAEENKFSPTVPDNWYPHARKLTSMKGIFSIIQFHGRNVPRALMDLFPEVNFDEDKFFVNESWHTPFHRRRFFEKFAADNHFDPLNAANWYSQAHRRIMQTKGAPSVVRYHNNSVSTALIELFPNIGLYKKRFQHWRTQPYA